MATGIIEIDFTGLKKTINTVNLPTDAVREIAEAAGDSANDTEGLTLKSGGKAITSLGNGNATISLPYTLKEGQDPSGVVTRGQAIPYHAANLGKDPADNESLPGLYTSLATAKALFSTAGATGRLLQKCNRAGNCSNVQPNTALVGVNE